MFYLSNYYEDDEEKKDDDIQTSRFQKNIRNSEYELKYS